LFLANEGSTAERKAFIRSFVKRITIGYPAVEIEYLEKKVDSEVLLINKTGCPKLHNFETFIV